MRLPGEPRPNSVWSYDFVHDRLANQRVVRLLCVLDEHTRECLAIEVARSLTSRDVILTLSRLMRLYGKPQFIRSDNVLNAIASESVSNKHPSRRAVTRRCHPKSKHYTNPVVFRGG